MNQGASGHQVGPGAKIGGAKTDVRNGVDSISVLLLVVAATKVVTVMMVVESEL